MTEKKKTRLFKDVSRKLPVVSSIFLVACQSLTAGPDAPSEDQKVSTKTRPAWEAGELELFTDYSDDFLCRYSDEPLDVELPTVDALTLWQRVRAGYALDWRQEHPRIQSELEWYQRHPKYLLRVSERSQRYLYYVVDQLDQRGMPMELALLPVVESAYDPFAYSHGRAAGMWQFIPGTAEHFGLKRNWWYDGRRDVVASTNAALDYLQALQQTFDGDWLLALAAYNSGQGTVSRAIRRNQAKGKPTDFWSLDLPRETRAYVPKLLALAKLLRTPHRYSVRFHPVPNQPYFAQIDTLGQIDLARAASLAGIDIEELYRLNPGFNRWATDPDGPHMLLVPEANGETLREALAQLPPEQRLRWQRYRVKRGDSLISIARAHRTDVNLLQEANQLRGNIIRAGDTLMIPSASQSKDHYTLSAEQRLASTQNRQRGGQNSRQEHYVVRSGDSFWSISRRYKVSVRQLAKWNGMAPGDTLRPGQKLSVWTQTASTARDQAGPPKEAVVRRVAYTVRSGDSLARIASRFRVGIDDIVRWNTLNRSKYLQPGQHLTLYVNVTNAFN